MARSREHVFATNQASECWLVDFTDAFSVGDGVERLGHLNRERVDKLHRQLWHADGQHVRRRIMPAVGQENEIRVAVKGCKVCCKHVRPAGRPRSEGLLANYPDQITAIDSLDLELPERGVGEKAKCLHMVAVATKFYRVRVAPAQNGREVASTLDE